MPPAIFPVGAPAVRDIEFTPGIKMKDHAGLLTGNVKLDEDDTP
jgi:hypothetical protein